MTSSRIDVLRRYFVRLWRDVDVWDDSAEGAKIFDEVDNAEGAKIFNEVLLPRYTEPQRHYHDLRHIEACLVSLCNVRHDGSLRKEQEIRLNTVELALWFHDAIYTPGAHDNEQRSADLAFEVISKTGIDSKIGVEVRDLIMATTHHNAPMSGYAALICDIDMVILGRKPSDYRQYAEAIRREFSMVPVEQYCVGRTKVLQGLLARHLIYGTRYFQDLCEVQARRNLSNEICQLKETT